MPATTSSHFENDGMLLAMGRVPVVSGHPTVDVATIERTQASVIYRPRRPGVSFSALVIAWTISLLSMATLSVMLALEIASLLK